MYNTMKKHIWIIILIVFVLSSFSLVAGKANADTTTTTTTYYYDNGQYVTSYYPIPETISYIPTYISYPYYTQPVYYSYYYPYYYPSYAISYGYQPVSYGYYYY